MGMGDISRIYIGNLPEDCSQRELEEEFEKFGRIIYCDLKKSYSGSPFAFIEFSDSRDARDAIRDKDGYEFHGKKLRVELPFRYRDEPRRPSSRRYGTTRRGKYVLEVTGLPPTGSWQDLKDHMRDAGECGHADVFRGGVGEITFFSRSDMDYAIERFDGSTFRSHEGEKSRISVREKTRRKRTRSYSFDRGRSHSRDNRRSRTYSRSRSRSRDRTRDGSRSRDRSRTRSRTRSRSRDRSRTRSRTVSRSYSRDKSSSRSRDKSVSRSRS
ncbi:splicing factor, putative [Theileria annulata]|uniref:Splicing factor, putative n=1 Tax=Theileria annulata TaxID=5874 RepID=Q4U9Z3_THEAN|nr:splicing factor, putative [Theileria annulata]CAI76360.1 splicing factor, putative [Theileria annulata]|eukprot:XP_952985.1 splicing factor, putative [Theileria annulata]